MTKTEKVIIGILGTVGLTFLGYKLFGMSKKNGLQNDGFKYKRTINYNGKKTVKIVEDIGNTVLESYSSTIDIKNERVIIKLNFTTTISPQLKHGDNTFMNKNNPGLSEEVHEHESIHIELWLEFFNNMQTIFNGKNYSGRVDKILTHIIKDNTELLLPDNFTNIYKVKEKDLINTASQKLISKFVNEDGVEDEIFVRYKKRHPEKTKFYNNKSIITIYQK
jgi:hypothetical protein